MEEEDSLIILNYDLIDHFIDENNVLINNNIDISKKLFQKVMYALVLVHAVEVDFVEGSMIDNNIG
jgi:hypothetical protein